MKAKSFIATCAALLAPLVTHATAQAQNWNYYSGYTSLPTIPFAAGAMSGAVSRRDLHVCHRQCRVRERRAWLRRALIAEGMGSISMRMHRDSSPMSSATNLHHRTFEGLAADKEAGQRSQEPVVAQLEALGG